MSVRCYLSVCLEQNANDLHMVSLSPCCNLLLHSNAKWFKFWWWLKLALHDANTDTNFLARILADSPNTTTSPRKSSQDVSKGVSVVKCGLISSPTCPQGCLRGSRCRITWHRLPREEDPRWHVQHAQLKLFPLQAERNIDMLTTILVRMSCRCRHHEMRAIPRLSWTTGS